MELSAHIDWFTRFVETFRQGSNEQERYIELKYTHSLRVMENTKSIVATLDLDDDTAHAAVLGGLYHDLGRFPQYAQYKTFSDRRSVNHGFLGCSTLKRVCQSTGRTDWHSREGRYTPLIPALHELGEHPMDAEPENIRRLVTGAQVLHNRFIVPAWIADDLRTVTNVVRDSDKLDIFPIMVSTFLHDGSEKDVVILHLEEREGAWSPAVQESVEAKRLANYDDMRFANDFKLLLGTWVFDLNYPHSRKLLRERGLMESLLATWPDDERLLHAREAVLSALYAEL